MPETLGTLELTKALRLGYKPVSDLAINFRKFARHTIIGSADDLRQSEELRVEATMLAVAVKQTVPTVMWNWLCKILHDEHLKNLDKSSRNMEKLQRYYGNVEAIPERVKRFHQASGTLELSEGDGRDRDE